MSLLRTALVLSEIDLTPTPHQQERSNLYPKVSIPVVFDDLKPAEAVALGPLGIVHRV